MRSLVTLTRYTVSIHGQESMAVTFLRFQQLFSMGLSLMLVSNGVISLIKLSRRKSLG